MNNDLNQKPYNHCFRVPVQLSMGSIINKQIEFSFPTVFNTDYKAPPSKRQSESSYNNQENERIKVANKR